MLPPLVPLPMMKLRVGNGWTVVFRKNKSFKRQVLHNGTLLDTGKKERTRESFGKKEKDKEEDIFNEESVRSGPKLLSPEKTPVFVFSSGPKPVKSGCGVSGPVSDPDVFVSGALFSVDGRSTLPGSENDMSMNQYLKGIEEKPVLGDTPPQRRFRCAHLEGCVEGFQPWHGRTCCFWKRASRGDRFAECGPCWLWCSGTFSCWHWSACFACQATCTGLFV